MHGDQLNSGSLTAKKHRVGNRKKLILYGLIISTRRVSPVRITTPVGRSRRRRLIHASFDGKKSPENGRWFTVRLEGVSFEERPSVGCRLCRGGLPGGGGGGIVSSPGSVSDGRRPSATEGGGGGGRAYLNDASPSQTSHWDAEPAGKWFALALSRFVSPLATMYVRDR